MIQGFARIELSFLDCEHLDHSGNLDLLSYSSFEVYLNSYFQGKHFELFLDIRPMELNLMSSDQTMVAILYVIALLASLPE